MCVPNGARLPNQHCRDCLDCPEAAHTRGTGAASKSGHLIEKRKPSRANAALSGKILARQQNLQFGSKTVLVVHEGDMPLYLRKSFRFGMRFEDLVSGRSMVEIAKCNGVGKQYVSRLIRLAFLAPEMVERIVAGRQPPELTAQALRTGRFDIPVDCVAQKRALGFSWPCACEASKSFPDSGRRMMMRERDDRSRPEGAGRLRHFNLLRLDLVCCTKLRPRHWAT
jgi:hypothetical protein